MQGGSVEGTIRDISPHGAFFAPADPASHEALARKLAMGERVALSFTDDSLTGLELPARVRWVGYSEEHGTVGFGVEFSHVPLE